MYVLEHAGRLSPPLHRGPRPGSVVGVGAAPVRAWIIRLPVRGALRGGLRPGRGGRHSVGRGVWLPTRVDLLGGGGAVVGRHDGGVLRHGRVVIAGNLLG